MANRFWVGGSATWDTTAGSKWALTTGGAGGQAVPTTSDDVFFDAASGAVTVTGSGTMNTKSLNFTNFVGTFAGTGTVNIYNGNLTFGAGMVCSYAGAFSNFSSAASSTMEVRANGITIAGYLNMNNATCTVTIIDGFASTYDEGTNYGGINYSNGILNINGNVTIPRFRISTSPNLSLGSGIITLTAGTGSVWNTLNAAASSGVDASSATIKMTGVSADNLTFNGNGGTYNNVIFSGARTGSITITGNSTFTNLTDEGTEAHQILFSTFSSNTITNCDIQGSKNKVKTLSVVSSEYTYTNATVGVQSYDFVCPGGLNSVDVKAYGSGGSGAGFALAAGKAGGGAGGQFTQKSNITVTPGETYSFVLENKANPGTGEGLDGGYSGFKYGETFYAKALGGQGGKKDGTGGTGSAEGGIGDVVYAGGDGGTANATYSGGGGGGAGTGGAGGDAAVNVAGTGTAVGGGNGGAGRKTAGNGNTGQSWGGGGSGALSTTTANRNGGVQGKGAVIFSPAFIIINSSGGTNTIDYVEFSNVNIVGDEWYGANSIDDGNNSGIRFPRTFFPLPSFKQV